MGALESVTDLDPRLVVWLQEAVPPALRPAVDFFSLLGGPAGWVVVTALCFWWSGSRLGVRVGLLTWTSSLLNVYLKWLIAAPRPFLVCDSISPKIATQGFGMPSGHAQGSLAQWGTLARSVRGWPVVVAAVVVVLGAGLARIHYGVHGVAQVLAGWVVGASVLLAADLVEAPLAERMRRTSARARWCLVIASGLLLFGAGLILRHLWFAGWEPPAEWSSRWAVGEAGVENAETPVLASPLVLGRSVGAVLGVGLVAAWYQARPPIVVSSSRERWLATLTGSATLSVLFVAGTPVVRRAGPLAELVRYALLLWVSGVVVPVLVRRLHPPAGE